MFKEVSEVFIGRVEPLPNGPYNSTIQSLSYFEDYLKSIKTERADTVILKPNILPTDYENEGLPVTNPAVCATAADILKKIGFKRIILAEGSTSSSDRNPDTLTGMKNNGFFEYEDKWEPVDLNKCETGAWFEIYSPGLPGNEFEIELGIADIMLKYPIISVAKFKTHDVLGLTLSVKNLMGAITEARYKTSGKVFKELFRLKCFMHGYEEKHPFQLGRKLNATTSKTALAININRLAKVIFPIFSILDAAPAMCGNGPLSGECMDCNLILASNDSISLDTIASEIAGVDPDYIQYIKNMGAIGLGCADPSRIKVVNADLEILKNEIGPFKMHRIYKHSKFTEQEIELLQNLTN
jgi:uncharacterized protein (DUF362 family)